MIFNVQFGINKHYGLVQFCWSLKNLLVLIIPNCTRNHVITYTNTNEEKQDVFPVHLCFRRVHRPSHG